MAEEKQDRRIKKTKQSIKDALVTLVSEKPLSAITIKEICTVADINRSTFYAHYTDQQELMETIEGEILTAFQKNLLDVRCSPMNLMERLKSVLTFVAQNRATCLALIGIHGNKEILKEVLSYPQSKLQDDLMIGENMDPAIVNYTSTFMINANASVTLEWLQTGMKMPVDDLAALLQKLSINGMNAILKNPMP